jgi:hypothetical protein
MSEKMNEKDFKLQETKLKENLFELMRLLDDLNHETSILDNSASSFFYEVICSDIQKIHKKLNNLYKCQYVSKKVCS